MKKYLKLLSTIIFTSAIFTQCGGVGNSPHIDDDIKPKITSVNISNDGMPGETSKPLMENIKSIEITESEVHENTTLSKKEIFMDITAELEFSHFRKKQHYKAHFFINKEGKKWVCGSFKAVSAKNIPEPDKNIIITQIIDKPYIDSQLNEIKIMQSSVQYVYDYSNELEIDEIKSELKLDDNFKTFIRNGNRANDHVDLNTGNPVEFVTYSDIQINDKTYALVVDIESFTHSGYVVKSVTVYPDDYKSDFIKNHTEFNLKTKI